MKEIIDNNGGGVGDKGNYAKEEGNAILRDSFSLCQCAATFDVTAILNKEDTTGGSQLGAALTDDGYSDFDGWQLNPIETRRDLTTSKIAPVSSCYCQSSKTVWTAQPDVTHQSSILSMKTVLDSPILASAAR